MLRLRNVTFKSTDAERLADFWSAALDLPERKSTDQEVLLADADWGFPRFTFQKVQSRQGSTESVHLDLIAESRADAVSSLIALGAEEVQTHGDESFRWTVMSDPDGNEFCVTE